MSDSANQSEHTFPLDPNTISQSFTVYFSRQLPWISQQRHQRWNLLIIQPESSDTLKIKSLIRLRVVKKLIQMLTRCFMTEPAQGSRPLDSRWRVSLPPCVNPLLLRARLNTSPEDQDQIIKCWGLSGLKWSHSSFGQGEGKSRQKLNPKAVCGPCIIYGNGLAGPCHLGPRKSCSFGPGFHSPPVVPAPPYANAFYLLAFKATRYKFWVKCRSLH